MEIKVEEIRRPIISRSALIKLAISGAFLFWIYIIWNSSTGLNEQLRNITSQSLAVHNLQVEYKNEVQEWKNVLLRSNNAEALAKGWRSLEVQHHKVAAAAQDIQRQYDVSAISQPLQTFITAHAENFGQYQKASELLARSNYQPDKADSAVKGIDRPLLDYLEQAASAVQEEERNISHRLTATARSQVEQSLFVLAFIALLVVWMPKW